MRRRGLAAVLVLGACSAPAPEYRTLTITPRLAEDEVCRPGGDPILQMKALGDFEAGGSSLVIPPREYGRHAVDAWPLETVEVGLRAATTVAPAWFGGALVPVPAASAAAGALLLPIGPPCDEGPRGELALRPGMAVASLADGGLLLVGGISELAPSARAERAAVRYEPGTGRVEALTSNERRYAATATRVGDRVVLAGGASGTIGPADESYEVYDPAIGDFILPSRTLCPDIDACVGRRDHGAAALADGRVVLVGGIEGTGAPPRRSVVALDIDAETVAVLPDLPEGRIRPNVVVLDDGAVYVVGGADGAGVPRGSVFRLAPGAATFETLQREGASGEDFFAPGEGAAVALPGARIAWLAPGSPGIELLRWRGGRAEHEVIRLADPFGGSGADAGATLPDELVAAALPDQAVLVEGRRGAVPEAWVLRLGLAAVPSRPPAERWLAVAATPTRRVPGVLLPLADGVLAGLDAEGLALRRTVLRSRFDSPDRILTPADLETTDADGGTWLAADSPAAWSHRDGLLVAEVDGARLDVAGILLGDFEALLDVVGGTIALVVEGLGASDRVELDAHSVRFGECEVARTTRVPVRVRRVDGALRLWVGAESATCRGRVGGVARLALVAEAGAELAGLDVTRL